jgi:hypothetical protein
MTIKQVAGMIACKRETLSNWKCDLGPTGGSLPGPVGLGSRTIWWFATGPETTSNQAIVICSTPYAFQHGNLNG